MSSESKPGGRFTTDSRGALGQSLKMIPMPLWHCCAEIGMNRPTLPGLCGLLAWLGLCGLPMACAQPGPSAARQDAAISVITVEKQCFGCANGERLELGRDGRARLTKIGHARLGTVDQVSEGPLQREEFERLARAVLAAGYFSFAERYEDEGLQDGAWVLLTVVRGGASRQVFRRENAGPQALADLLVTLDAARARIHFIPLAR